MRAHSSLRLGTLRGTTPELLASPWYCAWGFCMVWEAGLPHKTSSPLTQRRNGRACSSLTARGGGLPVGVTRDHALVHPADHLNAALTAIEEGVEVPGHLPQIVQEWRGRGIEGGEEQPLVAGELGHRDQPPLLPLQLPIIGFLQGGHPHQLAIVAIRPAMIGTGEGRGIANIGSAQPVAAVAADVEKGADLPRAVPHHQDRVLAHGGTEEVAGVGDLALVAQKQPAAGEDLRQLLLVDLWLDKDAPADQAALGIHQTPWVRHHATSPYPV